MIRQLIVITLIIILGTGVFFTQQKLDQRQKASNIYLEKNLLVLLPPQTIKKLTFGFDDLMADVVWLQFIQYFGENTRNKRANRPYDFSYIYRYIDLITTLDPDFSYAYWFGAFAIADEMERPDLAMMLLNRGIRNNPDIWWLSYTAGVMELMYNNDFVDAAKYFKTAQKINPNIERVNSIIDVMESKAEKQEKERDIWLQIYQDALKRGDDVTQERAKNKLKALGYRIVRK